MAQAGYTPISLYYSTTASAVPTAANLVPGELAININDGKLYYENSSGVVTLLAAASGASGDVVGPASSTDNAIARFDLTTGKLIQNSGVIIDDSNNITGVVNFTNTGNTILGDAAGDTLTINGTTVTTPNGLNFDSNTLVIDATNNRVGIGTASPAQALHINGFQLFENAGEIRFKDSGGTQRTAITLDSSNNFNIGTSANGALIFINGSTYTERMRINGAGSLLLNQASSLIATNTSDGSDSSVLAISGGGAAASTRGAFIELYGNENATAGHVEMSSGNVANSYVRIQGRSSSSFIRFDTNATERMRIDSSGNVGIGTSSPAARLNVVGGRSYFASNSDNFAVYLQYNSSTSGFFIGSPAADTMAFSASSGAERMRIDSSGNVGIGTSNPLFALQIGTGGADVSIGGAPTANQTGRLKFINSNSNINWQISTNDTVGGAFEIIPSTAAGGSTFTTPAVVINSASNVLFAKAVRATITTDNDLSFDMNAASNFKCTPTAGGALTFTNITSGQTGNIILVNNSNYAITAAATTKVSSTCLATISATGTYWLSYYTDGTNVYVANTGALA